jgi:hypothetical protein
MEQADTKHSAAAGAVVLIVVVILLAAYLIGGTMLHVAPLYAGLFFAVYWGNIKKADLAEWLPAVLGGLGGLFLAWGLVIGKAQYGSAGLLVMLALIILALYLDIIQIMPLVFNASFMTYLTLGGIPAVVAQNDFPMMIVAMLGSAAFFGGFVLMFERLQKPRGV